MSIRIRNYRLPPPRPRAAATPARGGEERAGNPPAAMGDEDGDGDRFRTGCVSDVEGNRDYFP